MIKKLFFSLIKPSNKLTISVRSLRGYLNSLFSVIIKVQNPPFEYCTLSSSFCLDGRSRSTQGDF